MYSGGILVTLGNVRVTNGSQINGTRTKGPGGGIAANFLGSVIVTGRSQVNDNTGAAWAAGSSTSPPAPRRSRSNAAAR